MSNRAKSDKHHQQMPDNCFLWVNPLPYDKIFALSKLEAFADDKLNVTQNIQTCLSK